MTNNSINEFDPKNEALESYGLIQKSVVSEDSTNLIDQAAEKLVKLFNWLSKNGGKLDDLGLEPFTVTALKTYHQTFKDNVSSISQDEYRDASRLLNNEMSLNEQLDNINYGIDNAISHGPAPEGSLVNKMVEDATSAVTSSKISRGQISSLVSAYEYLDQQQGSLSETQHEFVSAARELQSAMKNSGVYVDEVSPLLLNEEVRNQFDNTKNPYEQYPDELKQQIEAFNSAASAVCKENLVKQQHIYQSAEHGGISN